jgi:hypothetical protein
VKHIATLSCLVSLTVKEMEISPVGEEGKSLNFSFATRAINLDADQEQIAKYDEYTAKSNPLQYVALFIALGLVTLSGYLFYTGHWVWALVSLFLALFVFMLSRSLGKATLQKSIAYEDGLLLPGIIVNTNPLQVVAMADMRSEEDQDVIYGCLKFTVAALPLHALVVGERVPCVSLFGMAVKGYRRHFEPRPVSWGYNDPEIVKNAIAAIDRVEEEDEASEWEILEQLVSKMKDAPEKEVLFFNDRLEKVTL